MKKQTAALFVIGLVILLILALFSRCVPENPDSLRQEEHPSKSSQIAPPQANTVSDKTALSEPNPLTRFVSEPITFYGLIRTQHGKPVPEADVKASVADKIGGGSSKISTTSDKDGNFKIVSRGMSLSIQVSKVGLYEIPWNEKSELKSRGTFDYSADFGHGIHKPLSSSPVIFTLYDLPPPEPLTRIREKETMMPKNGEPVRVSLDAPAHVVELKCWTGDATKERDGRYDWKLEVSVVGGSLQRRGDSFDFTAPSDGYGQTDLIQMPRTLKRPDWQDDFEQSYWVRFSDGLFGNIKVRMIAGGSHYSIVSGYINPKPGSRNLAASPSKRK